MDPNPKRFPILSYVMARLPSLGPKSSPSSTEFDLEQPPHQPSSSSSSIQLVDRFPHLAQPEVIASMTQAVSDVAQARSILELLGDRPDHEAVDTAKAKIAEIEQLEEIVLTPRQSDVNRSQSIERAKTVEEEKEIYMAVIKLDKMHEEYEKLLKDAELRLVKIYQSAETVGEKEENLPASEEMNEEVVEILQEALGKGLTSVDLSNRLLPYLPEAFGKIQGLVVLNLSSNHLKMIPDSVGELENLEELNVSSNLLESLPDSIGLLHKLKILNASGNKLIVLPDSISHCRSLVELDVSYNGLTYLPTNIGYELVNLQRLYVQLNKIRSLPTSIGEMRSLRHLDAHFNELHGLPVSVGRLTNLEIMDLSSNFADMKELPETFGDLVNLKELYLSNNQIHALPDTFGCLDSLVKLNLEQNPLEVPPVEVVKEGIEAIKGFMAKRWQDMLMEEEQRSMAEVNEQTQGGWLTRSTSWLKDKVSVVSGSVSGYMGPGGRSPRDPYLDQQL